MSQNQFLNKKIERDKIIKKRKESEKDEKENNKDGKMKEIKNNKIIGIINVEKNDLKLRIINSYENAKEEENYLIGKENEEEIKLCEIFINDKKIDFSCYYYFKSKGKYKIKYIFKNLIKSTNYMFYKCNSLISLDLSNFNTQNVNNMKFMFFICRSLISLFYQILILKM